MNTISAKEAANRTRRAMALRDLILELGWDLAKAESLDEDLWKALALTIERRSGRHFREPSKATKAETLGLLRGDLAVVPVAMPTASHMPAPVKPVRREDLARVGRGSDVDRLGRKRMPTNVSLMVD